MLRSMTGFGSGSATGAGADVRVELRAVNHRFLQVKLRLPNDLSGLEGDFEGRAKKRLARGALNGSVVVEASDAESAVSIDMDAATRLFGELERVGATLGLEQRPTLSELLTLPGVLRSAAQTRDLEALAQAASAAFDQALEALVAMREREGRALAEDLVANLERLETLVRTVAERSPEAVGEQQAALKQRVAALLGPERPVEEKDLAREIALLADKLDVAEETSRLGMHTEQLRELIASGGAIGRKLDFLVQECLREVNTIGSKCNDAVTTRCVVDAKTVVERLREQVQNVE